MKIRSALIRPASLLLATVLLLGTTEAARAADLDQQAFNKAMDNYLKEDSNLQKVGEALENFYKKKQMEKQQEAAKEEKRQLEEQFNNPIKIDVGSSPVKGPEDAPVTIIEFSDFQCPFCRRGAQTVEEVLKQYPTQVKLAFKNLPLPFHPEAMPAAKAALAAGRQNKFWEMHDKLFENQQALGEELYTKTAQELGLNMDKFKKDMADPALDQQIQSDMKLANELGVRGTPGFFINGVMLRGAVPIDQFKQIVDRWLAEKK